MRSKKLIRQYCPDQNQIQKNQLLQNRPRACLTPELGICSFAKIAQDKWGTVSKLFRLLRTKERLWANCSGCSWQTSDREWFAQVAHDKRANERITVFFLANCSFALSLTKKQIVFFCIFFKVFIVKKKKKKFAHSLFFKEWCVRSAQVAHQKWATVSNLLRSLTENERLWANRSGCSPKMSKWANHFFLGNCLFAYFLQKTSDLLRKPMSKFPTLPGTTVTTE